MKEIIFPALEANKQLPVCKDKLYISFCDNCLIHCSDLILEKFAEKGVAVITDPPYTSNIFQVHDVLLFGRLESAKKHIPRKDIDSAGIDYLVRIFMTYEMVIISTTIMSSWVKIGFEYCKWGGVSYLLINDRKIRDFLEFSEI
jgi:hypothetical protein